MFSHQSPTTRIFINNSPKDGFREGDGDLMDKLTTELNKVDASMQATRIVGETPPAGIERPEGQLVVIDDLPEKKDEALSYLHSSQQKFVQYILADPAENKILYLGSRIDNFRKNNKNKLSISVGSGAFVTEDVLLVLKNQGVKVVVCCLEVEFYTRSLLASFRLHEMLRNHLQHADVIHCLTARDMAYLQTDLITQLVNAKRLVHGSFPLQLVEDNLQEDGSSPKKLIGVIGEMQRFFDVYFHKSKKKYAEYFANFDGKATAEKLQKIPCVYASGIATVTGLSDEETTEEKLMQRGKNILVFGLIRSHKGIEEGLALGKVFHEQKIDSTVYIVGKMLGVSSIMRKFFKAVFLPEALAESGINFADRFSVCNQSADRNKSFQALYDDLIKRGVPKQANIELALDVSDEKVLEYSRSCRYALKLDVKGFAENASSMISTMIGMCLPTIAQRGIVTPAFVSDYAKALCLLDSGLVLHNSEVLPAKVAINAILDIVQESDEDYRERIQAIQVLRGKKQFTIENTAAILREKVFAPLSKPSKATVASSALLSTSTPSFASTSYALTPARTLYAMFVSQTRHGMQQMRHPISQSNRPDQSVDKPSTIIRSKL
jgi:hypothetical protein